MKDRRDDTKVTLVLLHCIVDRIIFQQKKQNEQETMWNRNDRPRELECDRTSAKFLAFGLWKRPALFAERTCTHRFRYRVI